MAPGPTTKLAGIAVLAWTLVALAALAGRGERPYGTCPVPDMSALLRSIVPPAQADVPSSHADPSTVVGTCKAPAFLSKVTETPNADPKALAAAPSPLGDIVYGRPDAPVTVVEYSSLSCTFCGNFHRNTFPLLKRDYVDKGKVRWVVREFVGDPVSMAATRIARCAFGTGAGPYEDGLYRRQSDFIGRGRSASDPMGSLKSLFRTFGVDDAKFEACRKDETIAPFLARQKDDAQEKFLILGTPTFFVDGKVVTGDPGTDQFSELFRNGAKSPLDDLRAQPGPK